MQGRAPNPVVQLHLCVTLHEPAAMHLAGYPRSMPCGLSSRRFHAARAVVRAASSEDALDAAVATACFLPFLTGSNPALQYPGHKTV